MENENMNVYEVNEENRDQVEEEMRSHFDDSSYYPSDNRDDNTYLAESSNSDDGIGAAEVLVAGAAAVGVGTIGYGIYRGIKWIVDKIRGGDDDEEDEDEDRPRKKKAKKKPVRKSKKASTKKIRKIRDEDETDDEYDDDDFDSEEDNSSEEK